MFEKNHTVTVKDRVNDWERDMTTTTENDCS